LVTNKQDSFAPSGLGLGPFLPGAYDPGYDLSALRALAAGNE